MASIYRFFSQYLLRLVCDMSRHFYNEVWAVIAQHFLPSLDKILVTKNDFNFASPLFCWLIKINNSYFAEKVSIRRK